VLLRCCHTVVTRCYTVITMFLRYCYNVVTLWLHCCFTVKYSMPPLSFATVVSATCNLFKLAIHSFVPPSAISCEYTITKYYRKWLLKARFQSFFNLNVTKLPGFYSSPRDFDLYRNLIINAVILLWGTPIHIAEYFLRQRHQQIHYNHPLYHHQNVT
jgi:hypothetical protein